MFNLDDLQVAILQDGLSCFVANQQSRDGGVEIDVGVKPNSAFSLQFNPTEPQRIPAKTGLVANIYFDDQFRTQFFYGAPPVGGKGFRLHSSPRIDESGELKEEVVTFSTQGVRKIKVTVQGDRWAENGRELELYGHVRSWVFNLGQDESKRRHRGPQARATIRSRPEDVSRQQPNHRGIKRERNDEIETREAKRARGIVQGTLEVVSQQWPNNRDIKRRRDGEIESRDEKRARLGLERQTPSGRNGKHWLDPDQPVDTDRVELADFHAVMQQANRANISRRLNSVMESSRRPSQVSNSSRDRQFLNTARPGAAPSSGSTASARRPNTRTKPATSAASRPQQQARPSIVALATALENGGQPGGCRIRRHLHL